MSNLPKTLSELSVRRVFARFGKISSMKLVDKPQFKTNVAYIGYFAHANAALAIKQAAKEPELCEKAAEQEATTPVVYSKPRIRLEGCSRLKLLQADCAPNLPVQVGWLESKEHREQNSTTSKTARPPIRYNPGLMEDLESLFVALPKSLRL